MKYAIGDAVLGVDRHARRMRTCYADGQYAPAAPIAGPNQIHAWGYAEYPDNALQLLIEHEALHSWVASTVFGLPHSPELWAVAHHPKRSIPFNEGLPSCDQPWQRWTIPFEEAIVIATQRLATTGFRLRGWNAAFPNTDPLDLILRVHGGTAEQYRDETLAFLRRFR